MNTPQVVIKNFMAAMTNHNYSSSDSVGTQILDSAVQASSKYGGIQEVIDAMKADQVKAEKEAVEEVLGSSYAGKTISEVDSSILNADAKDYDTDNKGNAYYNDWNDSRSTVENLIKERKAYIFLEKYCGVLLADKYWITSTGSVTSWGSTTGNVDTGAITGSDANISLTAGDVVNGTTLTAADLQTLAKQDGASLSGDTLIIGTGVEKNENSVVPETGNLYTATTSTAQSISTGANDWLVVATALGDTVLTGGADSIDAGAGNDSITVGADHASIVTGAGSDTVNISAEVTTVTLEDLNSSDALTISGTFQVGSAQLDDTILVVTDKTGTRQIRLGDFDNAKNARINGTTIANWLSNAGIDINNLESSSARVIEESAPPVVEEIGSGRIDVERKPESDIETLNNIANEIQDLGGTGNAVALGNVTITGGSVTNGGNKLGDISNAFPNISTFTKRGLTINLLGVSDSTGKTTNIQTKTLDELTDDQKKIVAGLFKWWAKECLKLNEESYGISFKSDTAMVKEIGLFLYDSQGSGNTLATVWTSSYSNGTAAALKLSVNMNYYTGISEDNVDGQSSKTSALLDRTLSHEMTHAVMGTNIKFFSELPQFISEGMAELTHGIDDERGSRIFGVAQDASRLDTALDLTNTSTGTADAYAGGYMFLRYFARQAALQTILDAPSKVITLTEGDDTYQNTVEGATIQALGGNDSITNSGSNVSIDGGAGDNTVSNSGDNVSINGGAGNDSIYNNGASVTVDAGDGNDNITNGKDALTTYLDSRQYFVKIDGGAGNDSIVSYGDNVTIDGGTGKDSITSYFSGTITGGAGNDNISLITDTYEGSGNSEALILYNSGDGNDSIVGFNGNDTLQIGDGTGTYSKATLDNGDVEVTVGEGKITLVGAASLGSNLNIAGEGVSAEPQWKLIGTTATYGTPDNTLVTVNGVKSLDGISLNNKVVTISAASLDISKVTISGDGYTLALGDDVPVSKEVPGGYDRETQTATTKGRTAGYTLNNDGKSISYSTATFLEFKFKGLSDDATGKSFYINTSKKTIAIGASAVNPDKTIPVELISAPAGFKLDLSNGLPKPKLILADTYDAKTQTYNTKGTTAGYILSSDGKTISYSTGTSLEFQFDGISDSALTKGFFVSTSKKTIAIGASAVNSDKTIPAKLLSAPEGYKMELGSSLLKPKTISANTYDAKTQTYNTKGTTGGYTLSSDGKTISYAAGTSLEFKFSGISDSALTKGFFVSTSKKTIAIGASAVNSDKTIPVKLLSAPEGYKMELGSSLLKPKTISANTYDAKTQTYNTKGTTGGYTISSDGKTISYLEGTSLEFKFSGISDSALTKGFYVSTSKKTIAIGASAINSDKTIPVKLLSAPAGYKMELGSSLSKAKNIGTSTLEDGLYTAAGQTAGYTLSNDGKAIKYREALDTSFELDGIAAEPKSPSNGVVTLTPENFDKRLSVMNNEAEYAFAVAKGTYTGKTFTGSSDADTITSAGSGLIINAGKGNDSIENSGSGVKINGGLGNDYVKNSGSNVTLNGGTGNDTLWGGSYADTFVYKSGDGNDVIGGFDDNDLLQITGTFTTAHDSAAGTVKFTIGTGSITLTDFTATTFNVNGDSYRISGKTLVK